MQYFLENIIFLYTNMKYMCSYLDTRFFDYISDMHACMHPYSNYIILVRLKNPYKISPFSLNLNHKNMIIESKESYTYFK